MKKLGLFLVFAFTIFITIPSSYAQSDTKTLGKAQKKEYNAKLKQFKKEGWTVYGSAHSLDVVLLEHYQKLQNDGAQEIVGTASSFTSKSIGMQIAKNSACNGYARDAKTFVRGRIVSDMFCNEAGSTPSDLDKFYEAYESNVAKAIQNNMKPSFTVIRSKGMKDGKEIFEMQTFFIVNEEEASMTRVEAMQNSCKEVELVQQLSDRILNLIQESFTIEEP